MGIGSLIAFIIGMSFLLFFMYGLGVRDGENTERKRVSKAEYDAMSPAFKEAEEFSNLILSRIGENFNPETFNRDITKLNKKKKKVKKNAD